MKKIQWAKKRLSEKEKAGLLTEIGIMKQNETPYIVNCIEAFNYKGTVYIILELMESRITNLLNRADLIYSENIVKYVLLQTLKGLEFLDECCHIIHRDIKSDNILFNKEGEVKLADFGCSAQLTKDKSSRQTLTGTVHWIAPEMIKGINDGRTNYGCSADVWSFGIFAMELANGEPPFFST